MRTPVFRPAVRIRALSLVFWGWCLAFSAFSQDPIFSQFYVTPLQLNPGLAGLSEDLRVAGSYRLQYPGFNGAYKSYTVSADLFFPDRSVGGGFWLLSDDAGNGILKTIKAAGIFSYQLRVGDNTFLKSGAEVGIVQSSLRWDRLVFGDQLDDLLGDTSPGGTPFPTEEIAPDKNQVIYPDIGLGMVLYGRTLYAGLAVRHLNRPDPDFLRVNNNLSPRLPMAWTFHAGGSWRILRAWSGRANRITFSPSVLYARQAGLSQLNAGFVLGAGMLQVGAHYRHTGTNSDAIIGIFGLQTNMLRISYSYDMTISGLPGSGGSHELGLVYHFDDGDTESRYNDCLQLFR